jgi:acetoin utilization deacetylase AcuC-like enzyme
LTQDSVTEAKKAAASLCTLVSDVVKGDLDNGFAVIRPPGHHAEPGLAGGYCLINNVAVAAAYARAKLDVKKVLIVDWDIHHGNGTQSIFINDPNVLYFSVHRWQGGKFYPFLQNGGPKNVGLGEAKGFNVNVGWSRKGMSDDEYFAVWERVLMPIAREFKPDLVLVSAGFDGAEGDQGECNVTPTAFGHMTRSLMSLANGRVVCTLEGGYVRSILGKCVEKVVTALLDPTSPTVYTAEEDEAERERDGADVLDCIDPAAAKDIRSTIEAHQSYWKCFRD